MDLLSTINPLFSLSGFLVGLIVGLTGVGGGSLMTPLLVLLFGVHPATAVGTDLLYAAITTSGGTAVHSLHRTVDWRITLRLAAGSVPAATATLLLLALFGVRQPASSVLISTILGVALILTAIALVLRTRILALAAAQHRHQPNPRRTLLLTVATGAVLGVLVTLSSVGAGAIGITALILIYPRLPTATIVGSDIAHAVALTLVAGIGHWLAGSVDWALLLSLVIGSLPGIVIGSQFSARVPDRVLRPVLAATLVVVGGRLVL